MGILLLAMSSVGYAQTCCSGGVPLAGNLGLPAGESGQLQVGISYDLNRLRSLFTGSESLVDDSRTRNTQTILLEASYSLSDRWAVDVLIPYIRQERIIRRTTTTTDLTTGLGDAVALVRYQWLQPEADRSWQWASGLGVKLPNGAADRANAFGIAYNADLQPGSKAWDVIFWNRLGHQPAFRPSLSLFLTTVHRRRGVNDDYLPITVPGTGERRSQTYQFGAETQVTLGISDQVFWSSLLLQPGLSLLFRHAESDRTNDIITPSTGGDFLFIQPSLGVQITQNINWQLALDLPVYTKVTGTQVAPTLRLNTGFLVNLSLSK
ncbi:MAG: hypothetical protein AAGA62_00500 [Bacteroidota bacterium]